MKKLFVVLMLSLFSSVSFAAYETCEINNTGLPDAVVQKLKADCEALRLDQIQKKEADSAARKAAKVVEETAPLITPEKLSSWSTVAEGFTKAIGAAATQVGVSVNEFIKTPAGMITITVIIWKVFGGDLTKIATLIFLTAVMYYANRHLWTESISYYPKKLWKFEYSSKIRNKYNWKEMPDGAGWLSIISTSVYVVAFVTITMSIG